MDTYTLTLLYLHAQSYEAMVKQYQLANDKQNCTPSGLITGSDIAR